MSYQQLHAGKVKLNGLAGIRHHLLDRDRVKTNPDIDLTRSHLNHSIENLSPQNLISDVRLRIKQLNLKRKTRTDAVGLEDIIVGASANFMLKLGADKREQYFKDALHFFNINTEKKMSCTATATSTNPIRTFISASFPSLPTVVSLLAMFSTPNLLKNFKPTFIAKSLNITVLNVANITLATT